MKKNLIFSRIQLYVRGILPNFVTKVVQLKKLLLECRCLLLSNNNKTIHKVSSTIKRLNADQERVTKKLIKSMESQINVSNFFVFEINQVIDPWGYSSTDSLFQGLLSNYFLGLKGCFLLNIYKSFIFFSPLLTTL